MEDTKNIEDYELDRDIPNHIWNNYMKKYKGKYKLFLGKDNIWKISCKFGQIEPYSLKKGYLGFYGNFPTSQKKSHFLRKLSDNIEVTQSDHRDCVCKFLEANLPIFSILFSVRKRRHVSESQRLILAERLKKARLNKIGGTK